MTFQNCHLWVKIFKNQNRPIPAGKSCPEFIFVFFDAKTSLYIKHSRCGHVLATVRNSIFKILIFQKTHKSLFSVVGLLHGTQKFRNFYDEKVWCLSFLTHFRTSSYDLYIKSYPIYKFQNTTGSQLPSDASHAFPK